MSAGQERKEKGEGQLNSQGFPGQLLVPSQRGCCQIRPKHYWIFWGEVEGGNFSLASDEDQAEEPDMLLLREEVLPLPDCSQW